MTSQSKDTVPHTKNIEETVIITGLIKGIVSKELWGRCDVFVWGKWISNEEAAIFPTYGEDVGKAKSFAEKIRATDVVKIVEPIAYVRGQFIIKIFFEGCKVIEAIIVIVCENFKLGNNFTEDVGNKITKADHRGGTQDPKCLFV